jgi:hypothetical protein
MIEMDYGPGAMALIITIAIVGPVLYSFFVDHFDKKTPQKKNY